MKSSALFIIFLILTETDVSFCLTCHRAEYQIGKECCPMCPPGTRVNKHCTEFRSTSCLPCDKGTFMDEPTGMIQCLVCRICASGSGLKVRTSCSTTSNTECEPQDGFFCVRPPAEGNCEAAQRHKACAPGQYIEKTGSVSADTVCSTCPRGTFSNGTRCQPHTQCEGQDTLKAGTLISDAKCGNKSNSLAIAIGASVGVVLVLIAAALLVFLMKRRKNEVI